MKQIWRSRETELSGKRASDLVFKTHRGTYFVDTTTPPLKANDYYEEVLEWCYAKDLVKQTNLLQKKLEIATRALEEIERKSDKFDDSWSIQEQLDWIKAECQSTLHYLKEMEEQ